MITWSYSKFSTYESCTEKYYRKYVLKERPVENQRKYLEGSVLQTLFEEYVNTSVYTKEDKDWLLTNLDRHIDHFFDERKGNVHLKKDEDRAKIKVKIEKYISNTYDFFRYKGYKDLLLASEVDFSPGIRLNDSISIRGSIDFLIRAKDGKSYDVMDLKTTASKKYINKDQILFYALMVYLHFGTPPKEAYFYNAAKNEIINVPIASHDVQDLVDRLKRYTKEIESTKYRELTKTECWGCAHKELCSEEHEGDFKNGRASFTR